MSAPQHAHFIGIGGIGMSALARLLLAEGWRVSGCDLHPGPLTAALAAEGVVIYPGHDPAHVAGAALVVVTAAVPPHSPEIAAARASGVEVLKRAALLGQVMARKRGIAIAGSHGKTTTTALVGLALLEAGLDPTILVGGEVPELGANNLRRGAGEFLVAEADEFDGSFLTLSPEVAAVTNIEPEHLDFYGSFENVVATFQRFLATVPPHGAVVYCLDDPVLATLEEGYDGIERPDLSHKYPRLNPLAIRAGRRISYGFHPLAQWSAAGVRANDQGGMDFTAMRERRPIASVSLRVPGRHNVSNALAALAVADAVGAGHEPALAVLQRFEGVKRRFQVIGISGGVIVVDDYAHHPSEVAATLAAARLRYPHQRIIAAFQPHTYSRTRLLMDLFRPVFGACDELWITEIYPARERNDWNVSGRDLAAAVDHPKVHFAPDLDALTQALASALRPDDVLVLMGAGDIYTIGPQLLQRLAGAPDAG